VSKDLGAQVRRFYWQRVSAVVLLACVLGHLAVLIHAVRGGLSGAEILARTHGHWGFALFYGVFVLACAVHVPLGLANISREWLGSSERVALGLSRAFGVLLLVLGLRAVLAVFTGGL
jgi:fumarate reductase subunit C